MKVRRSGSSIYLDFPRNILVTFGWYPEAFLHIEINPYMKVVILSLLGLDFRVSWGDPRIAEEILKEVRSALEGGKEKEVRDG